MSTPVTLRRRPESCLSDLAIEQFLVGEVAAPGARATTQRHLTECAGCRGRRDELAAAPAQLPDELWWRARQNQRPSNSDDARGPRPARARATVAKKVAGGLIAFAAAAAVLALVVRPRLGDLAASGADTRTKGAGFALEIVARRTDGQTVPVFDGTALRPGDAIRFVVTAPQAGSVAVVGLDSAGRASVYAPGAAEAALGVAAGTNALDGSIVLDDTPGDERLVAVLCAAPPTRAELASAGQRALAAAGGQPARAARLDLPCLQSGITIRKEARR